MNNMFNLRELVRTRNEQTSFHLASEDYLRIQVFNLMENEELGTWKYDGNVLIIVIAGEVIVTIDNQSERAKELYQAVIQPGQNFRVIAVGGPSAVQIVWCPPFAESQQSKPSQS